MRRSAAVNARLAEEEAAAQAARELRNSMETAISEQRQRVARLEVELAAVVRDRDAGAAAAAACKPSTMSRPRVSADARVLACRYLKPTRPIRPNP